MTITLHIEPRRVYTWEEFVAQKPPYSIALDGFVESTQEYVSGTIRLKLFKGNCVPVGRSSPHSLYKKELSTYGKEDKFDQKLAEGFIKIWGMPYKR